MSFQEKYLKYKNKYLALKNQYGGNDIEVTIKGHLGVDNAFMKYKVVLQRGLF